MPHPPPHGPVPGSGQVFGRRRFAATALAWLLLALALVPALHLTSPRPDSVPTSRALAQALAFLVGSYLPWLLATPALFALCRRLPLGLGRSARNLGLLLAAGALVVPLLTACGWLLGHALLWLCGLAVGERVVPVQWREAILATTLFAVPLFLAVIGAGQILAYAERYRAREALLAQAREQVLRARLHHHFLFNALNAIGALGYRDPALADRALAKLGALLRALLDSPPVTSLREEMATATAFVDLHRLLLGEGLSLDARVDPRAWTAEIPAMLLQPLLENAVRHGDADRHLRIALDARVENGMLRLRLDNPVAGTGNEPGLGIGLDHLRRRLDAVYGDAAHLDAVQDAGRFSVRIALPYRPVETA